MSTGEKLDPERIKTIEAFCRIKSIEVGKPVTAEEYEAIRYLLGETLDMIKPFGTTVHFEDGHPSHTTDHDIGISVDGQPLEHRKS